MHNQRGGRRQRSASVVMRQTVVFGDAPFVDMPAAVIAGRRFLEAAAAIEWPAQEKLFEANPIVLFQLSRIERELHLIATAIAVARTELFEQGSEVIVN